MSKNVIPTESCASEKGTWEPMTPEKKEPRMEGQKLYAAFSRKGNVEVSSLFESAVDAHISLYEDEVFEKVVFVNELAANAKIRELEEANKRLLEWLKHFRFAVKANEPAMTKEIVLNWLDEGLNPTMEK